MQRRISDLNSQRSQLSDSAHSFLVTFIRQNINFCKSICLHYTNMYLEFIYGAQAKLIHFDDEEIEDKRMFITKGTQFGN